MRSITTCRSFFKYCYMVLFNAPLIKCVRLFRAHLQICGNRANPLSRQCNERMNLSMINKNCTPQPCEVPPIILVAETRKCTPVIVQTDEMTTNSWSCEKKTSPRNLKTFCFDGADDEVLRLLLFVVVYVVVVAQSLVATERRLMLLPVHVLPYGLRVYKCSR